MKALVLRQAGDKPDMAVEDRSIPEVQKGFSLVRMHAATVNPLSNWIRKGIISEGVTTPLVLSNDGVGLIEQSDVFAEKTPVLIYGGGQLGISQDGLQQQWVSIENDRLIAVQEGVDLDAAAALAINYLTAYQALHRVGSVAAGQTVLIAGASGSVGHALIQLCVAIGARPIGIVSTSNKAQQVLDSGAIAVIDCSNESVSAVVAEITDGAGVDWAFDVVGGPGLRDLVLALRQRGSVVCIGFSGSTQGSFDVADLVIHEKRVLGYDAHLETDLDVQQVLSHLMTLAADGAIAPRIDSRFVISDYAKAYARLESRKATGTILIDLN
ncbi:quinone oxidoreductase family protein [Pseudomonas sp. CIP-10]|uniref:quinone oxidoreductase family protein n=1 Tax=Pseudomonas sp. CIP-10 TaxID=2892442 RepID=UPI001E289A53|nr:zinc-binding alcohol dehydrogenase family protein [Pseudomonas sp. CIP-10]UFH30024.1 zinc-binding alcohol dehydrogenase family protein [Pseudomonas sp. CIP-10]